MDGSTEVVSGQSDASAPLLTHECLLEDDKDATNFEHSLTEIPGSQGVHRSQSAVNYTEPRLETTALIGQRNPRSESASIWRNRTSKSYGSMTYENGFTQDSDTAALLDISAESDLQ